MTQKHGLIGIGCVWLLLAMTAVVEARSLEEIRATGELRLCVAGSSHALYSMTGTAFAESLGVAPVVKRMDAWDQLFQNADGVTDREAAYTPHLLETGECDVYPNNLVLLDWRQNKMDFAVLYKTRMTVVVHQDNLAAFSTESDLRGKRAAVMQGTSYHTWMEQMNVTVLQDDPIQISLMPTDDSMLAVDEKNVDFSIIGTDGALNWTRKKVQNSAVAFFVGPVIQKGWGVRKGDADLLEALESFIVDQRKMGSRFDDIWTEEVGISFSDFSLYITNVVGE